MPKNRLPDSELEVMQAVWQADAAGPFNGALQDRRFALDSCVILLPAAHNR